MTGLTTKGVIVTLIRPNRGWGGVDWTGLREYSDLLWLLIRRDFVSKYKQTVLGPAWAVIQPLGTTIVFTVIFGNVLNISTAEKPAPLFYMSGLLLWSAFAGAFGGVGTVLQANAGLFSKIYFPRLIPPLANAVSTCIPFLIQTAALLFIFSAYALAGQITWEWRMIWFPLFALHLVILGLGCGLIFSSLTAVYRDLQLMLGFITNLLMYLSPVIFSFSELPGHYRWIFYVNPVAAPLEGGKWALLGSEPVSFAIYNISVVATLLVLGLGLLHYEKVSTDYVDRA
jgi:lipopolysaccharide transport system permease protein